MGSPSQMQWRTLCPRPLPPTTHAPTSLYRPSPLLQFLQTLDLAFGLDDTDADFILAYWRADHAELCSRGNYYAAAAPLILFYNLRVELLHGSAKPRITVGMEVLQLVKAGPLGFLSDHFLLLDPQVQLQILEDSARLEVVITHHYTHAVGDGLYLGYLEGPFNFSPTDMWMADLTSYTRDVLPYTMGLGARSRCLSLTLCITSWQQLLHCWPFSNFGSSYCTAGPSLTLAAATALLALPCLWQQHLCY